MAKIVTVSHRIQTSIWSLNIWLPTPKEMGTLSYKKRERFKVSKTRVWIPRVANDQPIIRTKISGGYDRNIQIALMASLQGLCFSSQKYNPKSLKAS